MKSINNDEHNILDLKSISADDALKLSLSLGMKEYVTLDDVPSERKRQFKPSIFPPTKEEQEWMNLHYCMRCVPQDEDTGGFFVATFRKIKFNNNDNKYGDKKDDDNQSSSVATAVPSVINNDKETEELAVPASKRAGNYGFKSHVEYTKWNVDTHKNGSLPTPTAILKPVRKQSSSTSIASNTDVELRIFSE